MWPLDSLSSLLSLVLPSSSWDSCYTATLRLGASDKGHPQKLHVMFLVPISHPCLWLLLICYYPHYYYFYYFAAVVLLLYHTFTHLVPACSPYVYTCTTVSFTRVDILPILYYVLWYLGSFCIHCYMLSLVALFRLLCLDTFSDTCVWRTATVVWPSDVIPTLTICITTQHSTCPLYRTPETLALEARPSQASPLYIYIYTTESRSSSPLLLPHIYSIIYPYTHPIQLY